MKLLVVTPLAVVVEEEDIEHVLAEDASGLFGLLPHHAELITALAPSVISWRKQGGSPSGHVAVRGGVLHLRRDGERPVVEVATREAMASDDLPSLEQLVERSYAREDAEAAAEHMHAARLHAAVYRGVMHYLHPELPAAVVPTPRERAP